MELFTKKPEQQKKNLYRYDAGNVNNDDDDGDDDDGNGDIPTINPTQNKCICKSSHLACREYLV